MKVQLNATAFRLSKDTESAIATPGLEKFCNDHGVVIEFITVGKENHIQWHDSSSMVDIPCDSVSDLIQYCKEYNAEFTIQEEHAVIAFKK